MSTIPSLDAITVSVPSGIKCFSSSCRLKNERRSKQNFAERFGDELFLGSKGRLKKRTLLVDDFISSKVWVNDKRIIQVLLGNKYFADYHATLRERYDELTVTS